MIETLTYYIMTKVMQLWRNMYLYYIQKRTS